MRLMTMLLLRILCNIFFCSTWSKSNFDSKVIDFLLLTDFKTFAAPFVAFLYATGFLFCYWPVDVIATHVKRTRSNVSRTTMHIRTKISLTIPGLFSVHYTESRGQGMSCFGIIPIMKPKFYMLFLKQSENP